MGLYRRWHVFVTAFVDQVWSDLWNSSFSFRKLTLLVGVGLTFAPKTRAICCQNVHPVCAWNDFVVNMSALAAHGTLLHILCFLE